MTGLSPGALISVKRALALVPVGRSTFYKLVAEGQIPSVRVRCAASRRGRILVHRADLAEFIDKLRAGGVA